MNVLVFGSRGLLGRALISVLTERGYRSFAPPRSECDVTHEDEVQRAFDAAKPALVFNAAAYNAVDQAERDPDAACALNASAPAVIARACLASGARLVHYSTDFVFDGARREPYTEDDVPNPLSAYGRSKLAGERAVLDSSARVTVIRTAWLYGDGGRNFGSTLIDRLLVGSALRVDATRIGSPTWVEPLAKQSLAIAELGHGGLFHAVCAGATSWYQVARFAAGKLDVDLSRVLPVAAGDLSLLAERPAFSALDTKRLREIGIDRMPPWKTALSAYLERRHTTEANR